MQEHLAEDGVCPFSVVAGKSQFHITGQLQMPGFAGSVLQRDLPDLDIILGRDDYNAFGLNSSVRSPYFRTVQGKTGHVIVRGGTCGVVCDAPDVIRILIPDVTEYSPVIPGRVRPPACNIHVPPAAVTSSRTGYHQAIGPVAQKEYPRSRGVGRIELGGGLRNLHRHSG